MRQSRLFSKTLREAPNGADCKGYEYLLRAGYIDQLAAGIFSLLPLGYRSIQKISAIVREEMNALGAQELLMPVVNPGDLWKETGRFYSIDREMSRFKDRNDRDGSNPRRLRILGILRPLPHRILIRHLPDHRS